MGWFTRIDRFGDTHICFAQAESESCGLASTKMVVFKINKLRAGKPALMSEAEIEKIYKKYDPTANKVGDEGVYFYLMPNVLNNCNIGTWTHEAPARTDIAELLTRKLSPDIFGLGAVNSLLRDSPIMLKVLWPSGASHAVVLDTITRIPGMSTMYAAICDPGDGDVHITAIEPGKEIQYVGKPVTFSANLWDAPKHGYSPGSATTGVIVEVIYRSSP